MPSQPLLSIGRALRSPPSFDVLHIFAFGTAVGRKTSAPAVFVCVLRETRKNLLHLGKKIKKPPIEGGLLRRVGVKIEKDAGRSLLPM